MANRGLELTDNSQIILDREPVPVLILAQREYIQIKEVLRIIDQGNWEALVPLLRKFDALDVKPMRGAWGRPASYIARLDPPGPFEVLPEGLEPYPHK